MSLSVMVDVIQFVERSQFCANDPGTQSDIPHGARRYPNLPLWLHPPGRSATAASVSVAT
jgi:hypothetical protein